jgi:hypothetical protein
VTRHRVVAALTAALALGACGTEDRNPEGAARLFLRAVEEGKAAEVFRLLAPASQQALERMAQLANAQAGGARRFKPEDLLAAGQEPSRFEGNVTVVEVREGRARVRISSTKTPRAGATPTTKTATQHDELALLRVGEVWRVVLPPSATAPRSPASAPSTPSTLPASQPTSSPAR